MQRIWAAALLIFTSTPCVGQANEKQVSTAAQFRAANIILNEVIQSLARFDYPNIDTADFSEKMSPYQEFLQSLEQDLKGDGTLDEPNRAALSFFCSTGMSNIQSLMMAYPKTLLIPKLPGDTPAKLKKIHAVAFEYFEEQKALAVVIEHLIGCSSSDPSF
jgi:hypothetical protein